MAFFAKTQFRLVIDGVPVPGSNVETSFDLLNDTEVIAIIGQKVAVLSGAHVVQLQWKSADGNTAVCRPILAPLNESASLFVSEV
jgi:hypothetical protein